MIIINEEVLGKRLDRDGISSNRNALKEGIVLIKYYRYLGLSEKEIEERLKEKIHITSSKDGIADNYVYNTLILNKNICGEFKNQPIPVMKSELEIIHNLNDRSLEQFTFVFLVLCKAFNNRIHVHKREAMRLSHLPESTKVFDKMFNKLYNAGLLDIKIDKFQVKNQRKTVMSYYLTDKFLSNSEDDEVMFVVDKTNDPVIFYMDYYGYSSITYCSECGCAFESSPRKTKYYNVCKNCKKLIYSSNQKEKAKAKR